MDRLLRMEEVAERLARRLGMCAGWCSSAASPTASSAATSASILMMWLSTWPPRAFRPARSPVRGDGGSHGRGRRLLGGGRGRA
jgi:hypothetical protein